MDQVLKNLVTESLLRSDQAVVDLNVQTLYKRDLWFQLNFEVGEFLEKRRNRWIIMPGLRGIGKTTLLAQIYKSDSLAGDDVMKFYFSFERLSLLGASVHHLVEGLRDLRHFYRDKPMLICLDDVHLDPQWSLGCKVIFDQLPNSFLLCTGSSALGLRLSPDSARRAEIIKVYPLSLSESVSMTQARVGNNQISRAPIELRQKLQASLFDADGVAGVYSGLLECSSDVSHYYRRVEEPGPMASEGLHLSISRLIDGYTSGYSSLPFFGQGLDRAQLSLEQSKTDPHDQIKAENRRIKYQIVRVLERTVTGDVIKLLSDRDDRRGLEFSLHASTVNLLPRLVRILANSDRISLRNISRGIGDVHLKTISVMLQVLVMSEIIIEVPALASSFTKSTKTPKYLFASPALRRALVPIEPDSISDLGNRGRQLKGRLLEETVIMYLDRIFEQSQRRWIIEYDFQAGAADFVVFPEDSVKDKIVMEVGRSKKDSRQVSKTIKRGGLYGLVITASVSQPRIDTSNRVVYVPLSYFLLA